MTRCLIVDDDPAIRAVVRRMLEPAGFDVEEADGPGAEQAFRRTPADLIVCDLFMPDRDGIEVIRGITREFPGIPVIAVSGGGFGGSVDLLPQALALGAADVLYKPFQQADLLGAVRRALTALPAKRTCSAPAVDQAHAIDQNAGHPTPGTR
jgi:CheY-like chemotaxis protein